MDVDRLKRIENQMIELTGEALASRMLSTFALDWLMAMTPAEGRAQQLAALQKILDAALTGVVHMSGNAATNAAVSEVTRVRTTECMQMLRKRHIPPN